MSKPNIEHRFGHNERGGGNCHQVDDYSLPQASASTSHPPHDLANACVTESAFSLEWGQSKSADGSNQLPRISKGLVCASTEGQLWRVTTIAYFRPGTVIYPTLAFDSS